MIFLLSSGMKVGSLADECKSRPELESLTVYDDAS